MTNEITDLEAQVLKHYYDDLKKAIAHTTLYNQEMAKILLAADSYKLALFVKYNINPFDYDISIVYKRFEKREEKKK